MANNFITNNKQHKTLRGRLNKLIGISDELKFLVGFFYFSGWKEVYEQLQKYGHLKVKLLVGLEVERKLGRAIVEYGETDDSLSQDEYFQRFITSMDHAINNEEMDTEAFYTQVMFFVEMLESGRLIIRKTENPNHAKLYLFRYNAHHRDAHEKDGQFITGSSNLTRAGLSGQEEFNVEIRDYGYPEAEAYFDELWDRAIPISEIDDRRKFLIEFIKHRSQAANVTPFEAYALILKTYLDLQQQKQIKPEVEGLLEEIGFKKFSYQLDAVNQALSILKEYNGVIIADVVGLGKSVIASMIAKNMGKRGMVICPPGLIGDKELSTGWWGYITNFKLYDWEVESRGRVEDIAESIHGRDIDVVIIDEAHYFRNQDTTAYEAVLNICRDKQVILLTATPFNNSPADIFSLLKLFIVPGKSGITLEDNLEGLFRGLNYRFDRLAYISKNHLSKDEEKVKKAEKLYVEYLGEELPIDIQKVKAVTSILANKMKSVMSNVTIRRNRLDLKNDFQYNAEVKDLSIVTDPRELFYELTPTQSDFYDKVITDYFGEHGIFSGAIYQPYSYEKVAEDDETMDEKENRAFQQQKNLFDFMRRLLVKRFESSFGAFAKSIERFEKVHKLVRNFIKNSGGKYILDRKLIENIIDFAEDEIEDMLEKFEQGLLNKKLPKNTTVYVIDDFELKEDFLANIDRDIQLFEDVGKEIAALNLLQKDPKRAKVYQEVAKVLAEDPEDRKVIIFSEFVDTVNHLTEYFRDKIGNRLLVCDGKVSKQLAKHLNENFNAQHKGNKENNFDVLITSDKLAEGFNLNRAGLIINYDIPWNPTKVIQRVGRINRIGTKVFDELHIYNFFPSEVGADIVKSREIAAQKMFLIHNSLGEDSKIFAADEEPTASGLFTKVNKSPDEEGEVNLSTVVRNIYHKIQEEHPEIIEKISHLPNRVKSAKQSEIGELNVLRKKGLSLFSQNLAYKSGTEIESVLFEDLLQKVACELEEPGLKLSEHFWPSYDAVKAYKPIQKVGRSDIALESKARDNLKVGLKLVDPKRADLQRFMKTLLKDIKKYHTLSKRSLRRLASVKLAKAAPMKVQKVFFDEVSWLLHQLGDDYLDRILERVQHQSTEVIIAVENQK